MINKYGDLYGAERIAELLGLDKSALDFDPTVETVEKEASLVSWLLFLKNFLFPEESKMMLSQSRSMQLDEKYQSC